MKNIVLIGNTGSGKTTLANELTISFPDYKHISSGEIATKLAQVDPLTQAALATGQYAPESAIRLEVAEQLREAGLEGRPFLLDGFPRRLDQLIFFEQVLEEITAAVPIRPEVLFVHVCAPTYLCIRRVLERGRAHDQPDVIASRMTAFERDTLPMIDILDEYTGSHFVEYKDYPPLYSDHEAWEHLLKYV